MKPTRLLPLMLLLVIVLAIASCASPEALDACVDNNNEAGFLHGLFQGFIAPIAFIISLFSDNIAMYAANNSGVLYDLGFLLGIGGFSGGVFKSRRRKKHR